MAMETMFRPWSVWDFVATLAMWVVMMIAMMVPSAAPTVLLYARLQRDRRGERKVAPLTLFLAGYLTAWSAFSLAATVAQWGLHEGALLSGQMALRQPYLVAAVLLATGLYQWSSLKHACLEHCQSPLGFLLGYWRDDAPGIFRMGWRHGLFCTGCCWLLMAILFVVGVMNLLWVALIAGYVLAEKVLPGGHYLARASGVVLCGAAFLLVV